MTNYFEVITDARTGEKTVRPFTEEEIAAHQKAAVPEAITPRQCRLMLLQMGISQSVEEMIAQQDEATKVSWEYATEFRRDNPLLLSLSANLSLSSAEIDKFFVTASKL